VKKPVLLLSGAVMHGNKQRQIRDRSPTTGIISAQFSQQCLSSFHLHLYTSHVKVSSTRLHNAWPIIYILLLHALVVITIFLKIVLVRTVDRTPVIQGDLLS
jgi:hypothetical protein